MKALKFIFSLGFLFIGVLFCNAQGKIHFDQVKGWNSAGKKAKAENKPIMAFIRTSTCQISKRMDEVFENPELAKYINDNFVTVMIDPDNGLDNLRVTSWGATGVPTFIFFNSTKDKVFMAKGYHTPQNFVNMADKALKLAGVKNVKKPVLDPTKEKGSATEIIIDESDDDEK